MRASRIIGLAAFGWALWASAGAEPLKAQVSNADRIRQHAESLARIRAERDALESQMRQMQGRVRDLSAEVDNITRQSATTVRAIRLLDSQLNAIGSEVALSTANLVRAQDELAIKQADLRRRLIDIYRRGSLHTLEVLFSAQSFTDLIARYKYLHLQTLRDRAMVKRVTELNEEIDRNRLARVRLQEDVSISLSEKAEEERRFRALEEQRKAALAQAQQSTTEAQKRLDQIAADERRLNALINSLVVESRGGRGGAAIPGASVFRAGAALDWPVRGELVYRFGRVAGANNTETRQNGIGIAAPRGANVRAVANGRVAYASNLPGYGNTVLLVHAAGDYTVYGSLDRFNVSVGADVVRGQIIGTIGITSIATGPHLHFEVRLGSAAAAPRAVDPLPYLRPPPPAPLPPSPR